MRFVQFEYATFKEGAGKLVQPAIVIGNGTDDDIAVDRLPLKLCTFKYVFSLHVFCLWLLSHFSIVKFLLVFILFFPSFISFSNNNPKYFCL